MSVILTNMEMPNSCYECHLKTRCEYALANGWLGNKRDDNCPLKPYEEHKKGKWIIKRAKESQVIFPHCSCCDWYSYNWVKHPFCPNCGAKMEE